MVFANHDDVIKWKHFPRYWPFVREIHRSPVNFPHKGQWRGALMSALICVRINGWVNNREAGDLRRYRAHFDVIVMRCDSDLESYPGVLIIYINNQNAWLLSLITMLWHIPRLTSPRKIALTSINIMVSQITGDSHVCPAVCLGVPQTKL